MPLIQVLDQSTINKIAAGEVIERPSSIVKELLENAIDAKATAITVEIKDGGTSLIRITDNGKGMAPEDVPLAFLPHATSKIRSVEDLITVASLGFRGEALSSIAAVCQVELITKTPDALTGTRYVIEGGQEKVMEEIGAPAGTTFLVRNLFFNTPARKKFLKTATTEGNYISNIVERIALSHPEISIRLIVNHINKLHTPGNGKLKDCIYPIYGKDVTSNLLSVDAKNEFMHIYGYIGKPIISRGNRNFENYYINGRYIKSNIIARAIEEGYKNFLMQHKYPFTNFNIDIDPTLLDVNVHPTKMELKFSNGEAVYHFIRETVYNALAHREMIPDVSLDKKTDVTKTKDIKAQKTSVPEPFEVKRMEAQNGTGTPNNERTENNLYNRTEYQKNKNIENEQQNSTSDKTDENSGNYPQNSELTGATEVMNKLRETADYEVLRTSTRVINNNEQQVDIKKETTIQAPPLNDGDVEKENNYVETKNVQNNKNLVPQNYPLVPESTALNSSTDSSTVVNKAKKPSGTSEQLELFDSPLLSEESRSKHKLIGQVFETYWIVQFEDKLFIIDQHAAHEKVLFEQFMALFEKKQHTSQMITPPIILSLSMAEEALLQKFLPQFKEIGFEIEPFGGREYAVRGVPGNLYSIGEKDLLIDLLDSLSEEEHTLKGNLIIEKIASMSCKAAVKGNNRLSFAEMDALMDQLLQCENPYNCPHGRPTIISMSKYELEKKFKRIV